MMISHLSWVHLCQFHCLLSLTFGKHYALAPARILANIVWKKLTSGSLRPDKLLDLSLQVLLILSHSLLD